MYVHSIHCVTQTAVEKIGIFPSVVISHFYIRNKTYVNLSTICYKTALFSLSKRLSKGIAKIDSERCVVKNNRRMLQNGATLFLLVCYK
jgi:hypothetical protein